MEITWESEDGYCGGRRPHHFEFDDDEIMECETVGEAMELIEGAMIDDFNSKVSPVFMNFEDTKEAVARLIASGKD